MSSPSLYKSSYVTFQTDEARVIDSNELFAKRFMEFKNTVKAAPKEQVLTGMSKDLEAASVAKLLGEDFKQDDISQEFLGEQTLKEEVYTGPSPEELIEEARKEAESILREAREKADSLKRQAEALGREEGLQAGYGEAMEQAQRELAVKEQALVEKEKELERYYEEKIKNLEPEFIDTLTGIYEHVFRVNLKEEKEMVVHLLEVSINRVGTGRNFIVHVSKEDYEAVTAKKDEIRQFVTGSDSTLEIIEDMTLSQAECMIETEGGIFDCSLGVQLEELSKKLRLLSYERN